MQYELWDKRLIKQKSDFEQSSCVAQLTKREYRIIINVTRRCGANKEIAFDEFLKEVLNSKFLPTFSDTYLAEKMWNQAKRINVLSTIMDKIYKKYKEH